MEPAPSHSKASRSPTFDVGARALLISALASAGLGAAKLFAFQVSGSLLALAGAFDSFGDVVVSLLNAWAHREARRHADVRHPFGHGGIEVLTTLGQALMLGGMAAILIYRAAARLLEQEAVAIEPQGLPTAIGILVISALGGYAINHLLEYARRSDAVARESLSVQADRAHYAGDALSNLLSAVGLVIVWYTGEAKLDALLSLLAGGMLAKIAWPILQRSVSDVVHTGASVDVQQQIRDIVCACDPRVVNVHRVRTRRMGPTLFVDLHLVLPDAMPLATAHAIGEHAVVQVKDRFPEADVLVHLDPDSEPEDDLPFS